MHKQTKLRQPPPQTKQITAPLRRAADGRLMPIPDREHEFVLRNHIEPEIDAVSVNGIVLGETLSPDDFQNPFYIDFQQAYHQFEVVSGTSKHDRVRYRFPTLNDAICWYAQATGLLCADIAVSWILHRLFGEAYDVEGAASHAEDFVRQVKRVVG